MPFINEFYKHIWNAPHSRKKIVRIGAYSKLFKYLSITGLYVGFKAKN